MGIGEDRFDHLRDGSARSIVRRAGLQMSDHFGATLHAALHHFGDLFFTHQLSDGTACDGGVAWPAHHTFAVCAKRPCHHVRWIAAELFADGEPKDVRNRARRPCPSRRLLGNPDF